MSFAANAVVLAAVVACASAIDCTASLSNAVLYTANAFNKISDGSTASVYCLPGYGLQDSSGAAVTQVSLTCTAGVASYTSPSSGLSVTTGVSCSPRQDYCSATINAGFGNTTTVTNVYSRAIDTDVYLVCKPAGLGRNWRGNGTAIKVSCKASADATTGVWVSEDWCSGVLGVSANGAVLALAAVAGLLLKRFF